MARHAGRRQDLRFRSILKERKQSEHTEIKVRIARSEADRDSRGSTFERPGRIQIKQVGRVDRI